MGKRSARDKVLNDIELGKRGALGGDDGKSSESVKEFMEGFQKQHEKAKVWGLKGILITLFVIALLFGGFYLYGYVTEGGGSGDILLAMSNLKSITLDPIFDALSGAQQAGAGGYFSTKSNSSSTKSGIDLKGLDAVTGESLPAGVSFDLKYDINYENIGSQSIEMTFFCQFDATDESEEEYTIQGEIIPGDVVSLQKGTSVYCRINGEETQNLNGDYVIRGGFSFPYETKDAILPVYFIQGDVADDLEDEDFFDAYDLDVSRSDLRVTYNGEPISVAIGTGGEGDEEQPVIVRGGDAMSYNTVGITLRNVWGGDIVDLTGMELILPEGVVLDDELNKGSASCPFIQTGDYRGSTVYTMSSEARSYLFDNYFSENSVLGPDAFWIGAGTSNVKTFQCWIDINEDFFSGAPYVKKEYQANIDYIYKVKEAKTNIEIIGTGGALVGEEILE